MSDVYTGLVQRFLDIANDHDADSRLAAITEAFTEDCSYTDPTIVTEGRQALSDYLGATLAQMPPGFVFALDGKVDGHHDQVRFPWQFGPADGAKVAGGYDFFVLNKGKIQHFYGFFD